MADVPSFQPDWTLAERWAWSELVAGRAADFDKHHGNTLDPAHPADWRDERTLRREVVSTILDEPYVSALGRKGAVFRGARFSGGFTAAGSIPGPLALYNSRIEGPVSISSQEIAGALTLQSLWVQGFIVCIGAHIRGAARLGGITAGTSEHPGFVDFSSARIAGDFSVSAGIRTVYKDGKRSSHVGDDGGRITRSLSASNAVIDGDVLLSSVSVESVFLEDIRVGGSMSLFNLSGTESVTLQGASVAGQVTLSDLHCGVVSRELMAGANVEFRGTATYFDMQRAHVRGGLELSGGVGDMWFEGTRVDSDLTLSRLELTPTTVADLRRLRVGGSLIFDAVTSARPVWLDSSTIGGDLQFDGKSRLTSAVRAPMAQVGGSLRLGEVEIGDVDLSGAHVKGDLELGSAAGKGIVWDPAATLELRNAEVGAVAGTTYGVNASELNAWPLRLDLRGFTFHNLVSFGVAGKDYGTLPEDTLREWLARDRSRSAQPYIQLAQLLRETGDYQKANSILYAERERARHTAWQDGLRWRWAGLSLLNLTIGYGVGLRYFRALIWVVALIGIGSVTLHVDQWRSGQLLAPNSTHPAWTIAASLDALLPIVSLDKSFSDNVPGNLGSLVSRSVFWGLAIAGWILGSFLVAGLAGLTQKSGP